MLPASAAAKSALLLSTLVSVVSVNLRARPSKVREAECMMNSSLISNKNFNEQLVQARRWTTQVPCL